MRRPVLALLVVLAAIGAFAGGLAWLLDTARPPAGATKGQRLYLGLCATCHGSDGRGSWRAALANHVGTRARHDRPAHLVSRGTDDRPPDARGERREQRDEQEDG